MQPRITSQPDLLSQDKHDPQVIDIRERRSGYQEVTGLPKKHRRHRCCLNGAELHVWTALQARPVQ